MSKLVAKKIILADINNGNEYEIEDGIQPNAINSAIEGVAYAQNQSEIAVTTANEASQNANEAISTANTAKNTADGLALSIEQSNNTAQAAKQIAEEAKEIAEGAAQGNGTRVSVGGAFQQTLSFTSDPQMQIAQNASAVAATEQSITDIENGTTTVAKASEATKASQDGDGNNIADTYALLPTSVTNTFCASGQWAVSASAGPGTYLIGTFNVYDSNIHLKISGGIVMAAVDNTTDAEVFISTTNYTVEKAVCFANKLYKTSTRTGLYYTIDSSHNLRIFAPMPDYGKLFISAEITGGTITGKGDGSLQSPSGGQYIPEKNYAYLSQGESVFATDPTKLTPSTANGWTQTTVTGSLPSSGVYMVSFDIQTTGIVGTGILFFDGSGAFTTIGTITGAFAAVYSPSMSTKWLFSSGDYTGTINAVYYKRIA